MTVRTLLIRLWGVVGAEPHELIAHDGRLYVGSRGDGTVSVIDAASYQQISDLEIGERIEGMAALRASNRGYGVDVAGDRIVAFDLDAGASVVAETNTGNDPGEVDIVDGSVFVSCGDGTVYEYTEALDVVAVHDGFGHPEGVYSMNGDSWVIDRERAQIQSLSGAKIDTPAGAIDALSTGTGLVLSHYYDATISLVRPEGGVRWQRNTGANPFGAILT